MPETGTELDWHPIDPEDAFPFLLGEEDRIIEVKAGGKRLCLVRQGGELYAMDARCPHQGGSLAGGYLEGDTLYCPLHRFGFKLQSGECTDGGYVVSTYPLKRTGRRLQVGLSKRKGWL